MQLILFIFNSEENDMKRKLFNIVSFLITIFLTGFILIKLTDLMERKSSDEKYEDFWKQEEDFDVLFFGTSHVINAVFPMEMWNDYGIVSYNFGGHGNQIPTTYWVMENALEKTTPKVAVIDCYGMEQPMKSSYKFSLMHISFDTFPLNRTKIAAIWDLLDDPAVEKIEDENLESRSRIELLWNYSVYHSRWSEMKQEDFKPDILYEKGAESRYAVVKGELSRIPVDEKMESGSTGDIYLRKIIESCQERGIEVVLTYLPYPAPESHQMAANYVYDVAEEYGVDYINFLDLDVINYKTDLYDAASHLNPSGARKVSKYLGEYLSKNKKIPDRRLDSRYAEWKDDYEEYRDLKDKYLSERINITEYLMALSGDDVEIRMDIRDKRFLADTWVIELLANIGVNRDRLSEHTDFILVNNTGKEVTVVDNLRENGDRQDTEKGIMEIVYDREGLNGAGQADTYGIYLDGRELMTRNETDNVGLRIDVYREGEKIDSVGFYYSIDFETSEINSVAHR